MLVRKKVVEEDFDGVSQRPRGAPASPNLREPGEVIADPVMSSQAHLLIHAELACKFNQNFKHQNHLCSLPPRCCSQNGRVGALNPNYSRRRAARSFGTSKPTRTNSLMDLSSPDRSVRSADRAKRISDIVSSGENSAVAAG